MKSNFNSYIISLICLFTLGSSISKQETAIPDVDAYAKRVFEILISQDSVAYKNEFEITDSELNDLVYQYVKGDSLRQKNQGLTFEQAIEKELTDVKISLNKKKSSFFNFDKEFQNQKLDVNKCKFLYATFKIENERKSPQIIMGRIKIVFMHEGKRYSIRIKESVVANGRWKIVSLDGNIYLIDKPQIEATLVDSVAVVPAEAAVEIPAEYSKTHNSKPKKKATLKKKVVKK